MLTHGEQKIICLEYKCWIDESGNLFYFGEPEDKSFRIGKIYYRELTKFYHVKYTINKINYEGNRDFRELLITVLKGENII
jgi:hypothetical protein